MNAIPAVRYIDSHCHVFEIKGYSLPNDLVPVVVAYSHESNVKAHRYATEHGFPFVLGIAPQTSLKGDLRKLDEWIDFIKKAKPNAVGEIGLDYKWATGREGIDREMLVFERMLNLSDELGVPVVINSRNSPTGSLAEDKSFHNDAIDDILSMLSGRRFLMHFFSGTSDQAEKIVQMGGYVSVSHMRSKERRKTIERVPLERLLVESDAPYVGRTPDTVRDAVAYISEVKAMPLDLVARQTLVNAMDFFDFTLK